MRPTLKLPIDIVNKSCSNNEIMLKHKVNK